jgi:hypothetical protein
MDLTASWTEYMDVTDPANPTKDPSIGVPKTTTITSVNVAYTDTQVHAPAGTRHAFGDTKRRTVQYQWVGTTRYREYFPPSITSVASNIQTASAPVQITVPACARPPAPHIKYVVPSFKFTPAPGTPTLTKTRVGGGLRVYVDRGWFATGEDERLAVIIQSPTDTTDRHAMVTVWGDDPIWFGQNKLAPLDEQHFAVDTASDPYKILRGVQLADGSGQVTAITYKPQWSADRQLWYFDIELNTDQSYFPFVRLALARCQPITEGDLRLSKVVLTEFAQLAANRTVSVAANGPNAYTISVAGPTGSNLAWTSAPSAGAAASGHTVLAEIQELNGADDPLNWTTIGGRVMLNPQVASSTQTYTGSLTYPRFLAKPGARHRVLIREYEIFATDDQAGVKLANGLVHFGDTTSPAYQQRLVYTDSIEITR